MANGKPGRTADAKGRSSGDQFLAIPYVMARSAAFRSLSGSALKVWVEVRSRYDGTNNGRLTLSMDEAKRLLGMGKSTVARAIEELIAKGFIKVRKPGQWYGRLATQYEVTDRGILGQAPSNDWKKWTPDGIGPVAVPKNRNRSQYGTIDAGDGTAGGPRNA